MLLSTAWNNFSLNQESWKNSNQIKLTFATCSKHFEKLAWTLLENCFEHILTLLQQFWITRFYFRARRGKILCLKHERETRRKYCFFKCLANLWTPVLNHLLQTFIQTISETVLKHFLGNLFEQILENCFENLLTFLQQFWTTRFHFRAQRRNFLCLKHVCEARRKLFVLKTCARSAKPTRNLQYLIGVTLE